MTGLDDGWAVSDLAGDHPAGPSDIYMRLVPERLESRRMALPRRATLLGFGGGDHSLPGGRSISGTRLGRSVFPSTPDLSSPRISANSSAFGVLFAFGVPNKPVGYSLPAPWRFGVVDASSFSRRLPRERWRLSADPCPGTILLGLVTGLYLPGEERRTNSASSRQCPPTGWARCLSVRACLG